MNQLIIIPFLISEFIILYSHFKLKFKYAQSFLALHIFLSIKMLDKKMSCLNIIFIFGLIIVFSIQRICLNNSNLNQRQESLSNQTNNIDGFKNRSLLNELANNKKIKKYESSLNNFTSKKKSKKNKEKFMSIYSGYGNSNNAEKVSYFKSFKKSPIYNKKYRGSVKTFGKKMPFYIEKFKEIFK